MLFESILVLMSQNNFMLSTCSYSRAKTIWFGILHKQKKLSKPNLILSQLLTVNEKQANTKKDVSKLIMQVTARWKSLYQNNSKAES